jgi:hypothetical protein
MLSCNVNQYNRGYSFFTHFLGYLYEKLIFWKNQDGYDRTQQGLRYEYEISAAQFNEYPEICVKKYQKKKKKSAQNFYILKYAIETLQKK